MLDFTPWDAFKSKFWTASKIVLEFAMKELGFEKLLGTPKEAFGFLKSVSVDASQRLFYRFFAETNNIDIPSFPLGGEENLEPILSFLPNAREGFAYDLRSDEITHGQTSDILAITTPVTLNDLLTGLEIRIKRKVEKMNPNLALYRHTIATLSVLSGHGTVDRTSFANVGGGISYWPRELDIEHTWALMEEIENATREMLLDPSPTHNQNSAARAAHFFAAGAVLAEKYR